MTQPLTDRLGSSLAAIQRAQLPRLPFLAVWEYRVIAFTPGPPVTIDCQAIDPDAIATLPPTLVGVTLWPGPSGFVAVPTIGSIVRVQFINGDPSKAAIVGLDPNVQPTLVFGYAPVIELGDVTASPLAKAGPLTTLYTALGVWAAAVSGALSAAGFPIAAPEAAFQAALTTATTATPTTKVLGT